jgi:cellulose synthase/poly-beta-1,6-N-acetylglucosamine synthase-like glycosyltransferase
VAIKRIVRWFCTSSEEVEMNWNTWIRQIHRWLSIAFTLAVIVNIIAMLRGHQVVWVGLVALFPLILLLLTGLYMFALPYLGKRHSKQG